MNINLGEILTKAWQITWKFKVLWIFGILAGCAGNNQSRFNFNGGSSGGRGGSGEVPDFWRPFNDMRPEEALRAFLDQYMALIIAILCLLCVIWLLSYFLGIMGKTGLIKGVALADGDVQSLTFGELWTESLPYFWRMFGLSVLIGLPVFLIVVILLAGLAFAGFSAFTGDITSGGIWALLAGAFGIFIVVMCILSLIMMVVNMIVEQAQNAIILEDRSMLDGLSRGWNIFSHNVISIIVVAVILWILGIVISIIIAIPVLIVMVPVVISVGVAISSDNYLLPLALGTLCLVFFLLPIGLLVSGVQNTYFQSVWTLTYRRLTAQIAPPPVPPAPTGNLEPQ